MENLDRRHLLFSAAVVPVAGLLLGAGSASAREEVLTFTRTAPPA